MAAATAWAAPDDDLRRENERLKDEIAALKAGDPAAARRKAVEDYLAGHRPEDMARYDADLAYQGGFVLATADGQHLLRINLLSQFGWRWTKDVSDERNQTQSRFNFKRLRLRLSGHGFSERLQYFVDLEFAPNAERFDDDADPLSEGWFIYRRIPWRYVRIVGGRLRPRFTPAENVDDMALALNARGLVSEYFTVGRTNGIGVIVENLFGGRTATQLTFSNGSERFDPDKALSGDDKRGAISLYVAHTVLGEGAPWPHQAYEGDPYNTSAGVLVIGFGLHLEDNEIPETDDAKFLQLAVDLVWRRRGSYVAVHAFVRRNRSSGTPGLMSDEEDAGVQVTASHFVIPRRMEVALRGGWIDYAPHKDPGGDLWEFVAAWSFYWKHENDRIAGHRLRVTLDVGWAERVVLQSDWTGWPGGHVRGWIFRSQITILF